MQTSTVNDSFSQLLNKLTKSHVKTVRLSSKQAMAIYKNFGQATPGQPADVGTPQLSADENHRLDMLRDDSIRRHLAEDLQRKTQHFDDPLDSPHSPSHNT